jgi:glucose/arabinose dehydrogenase
VDIKIQPDGKIYISDDKAGVIYLVEYRWILFLAKIY